MIRNVAVSFRPRVLLGLLEAQSALIYAAYFSTLVPRIGHSVHTLFRLLFYMDKRESLVRENAAAVK